MTQLEKKEAEARRQELQARRQELQARRAELYRDHPEAERFMKAKSGWLKFLLLFCFGLTLGKAVLLRTVNGSGLGVLLFSVLVGFGMNAIFLAAGMGFRRKLAFVLYGWALYSLYRSLGPLMREAGSLARLAEAYRMLWDASPAAVVLDLLSLAFIVLVLLTAAWLTLPPGNRRLAEEAEGLEGQWRAYIASQPVEKSK